MAFHKVKVAARMTGTSGVSISISEPKEDRPRVVRLSFTADAQKKYFGRLLNDETDRFEVLRGDGPDRGKVLVQIDEDGEVCCKKGMHGSVFFKLAPFPPIPPEKVKSMPCIVLSNNSGQQEVTIRVPWNDGSDARRS